MVRAAMGVAGMTTGYGYSFLEPSLQMFRADRHENKTRPGLSDEAGMPKLSLSPLASVAEKSTSVPRSS